MTCPLPVDFGGCCRGRASQCRPGSKLRAVNCLLSGVQVNRILADSHSPYTHLGACEGRSIGGSELLDRSPSGGATTDPPDEREVLHRQDGTRWVEKAAATAAADLELQLSGYPQGTGD